MTTHQEPGTKDIRIGADAVKAKLLSDVPLTLLDARSDEAWESSLVKIRGAVRIRPADWHIDPAWPKDRLMVVY